MSAIFTRQLVVPHEAIDALGHVNNTVYVQWMQDVAIAHSASFGWTMEHYFATGMGWVARSHYIEYIRPAFEDDPIDMHTWIVGIEPQGCPRRYLFVRSTDRKVVIKAETWWVYVDMKTGRPVPVPQEMRDAFQLIPAAEEAAGLLGLETKQVALARA